MALGRSVTSKTTWVFPLLGRTAPADGATRNVFTPSKDQVGYGICLGTCYAVPGTDLVDHPHVLRAC
eukprot:810997-Rhodomonas_salina.1